MEVKTVGLACDHAGYPLKQFVLTYLEQRGYPCKDYGTFSDQSVDYPDFAHALAEGIESGEVYPGIAICGSGAGMAITGRFIDNKTAEAILDRFFTATFEGGRHERRVSKIPVQR